ncbi:MAG: flagellar export chaperone FliS [Dissulfuribacterales bacterium]
MNTQAVKAYKSTQVMTTDSNKLILMLYDACIKNLFLARDAVMEKDIVRRGETISKAIDILSELFSSVRGETEQAKFLRGLYSAMMLELPKVNLTNDTRTLDLAIKYVAQLRSIWKEQVMAGTNSADAGLSTQRNPQKGPSPHENGANLKITNADMGGRAAMQQACYKPFACKF